MSESQGRSAAGVVPMSTSGLEAKLRELKDRSSKHGQALTQKLASSQSGQDLLHIGTSLQTLPSDLHAMLQQLHSVVSAAESVENKYLQQLKDVVNTGMEIRAEQRRIAQAVECAQLYRDIVAAEKIVKLDASYRRSNIGLGGNSAAEADPTSDPGVAVEHVASLERCAHVALAATQELQAYTKAAKTTIVFPSLSDSKAGAQNASSAEGAASTIPSLKAHLEEDSERAHFLMKLAPRIRRLESDTVISLTHRFEQALRAVQRQGQEQEQAPATTVSDEKTDERGNSSVVSTTAPSGESSPLLLLTLGQCMRGLTLLGRAKDIENSFARVAIMPLVRSKMYMGRLDEGGPRGECTGLPSLLQELIDSISAMFGPVLALSEAIFNIADTTCDDTLMEVDLVTEGVWVPIVTALMSDASIKMAIFSPGIAKIVQRNYVTLDKFLSTLAEALLNPGTVPEQLQTAGTSDEEKNDIVAFSAESLLQNSPKLSRKFVQDAQLRILAHSKTEEFSKKWNLPIYYQLRFGDCCNRMNAAIEKTKLEGWSAAGSTGDGMSADDANGEDASSSNAIADRFSLFLFRELWDVLSTFWRPDVVLKPLTHRFLRGSVQIVGRILAFVEEGMEGELLFGETDESGSGHSQTPPAGSYPNMKSYNWGDSELDVACVTWELSVLESALQDEFVTLVCSVLQPNNDDAASPVPGTEEDTDELRRAICEFIADTAQKIDPIISKGWNEKIVDVLIKKCAAPLAAVKGVAATYRMTNRPPPTHASHFVSTILRPLKEFCQEFASRTPPKLSQQWKVSIVSTISNRYADAIRDLLETVQKTEAALLSRRARRAASGGVSDGDKVKLQLYLDYKEFLAHVKELDVDISLCEGIRRLESLTQEGAAMSSNA